MRYKIELEVEQTKVQTILSVLAEDGLIFRCNPIDEPPAPEANEPRPTRHRRPGHRDPSGLRGSEHVERILRERGKPMRLREIEKELKRSTSLSSSSASPSLNELKKNGAAENDGNGLWWLKDIMRESPAPKQ